MLSVSFSLHCSAGNTVDLEGARPRRPPALPLGGTDHSFRIVTHLAIAAARREGGTAAAFAVIPVAADRHGQEILATFEHTSTSGSCD